MTDLDDFARGYYLNTSVPDIAIEESMQLASLPTVLDALRPAERVLEMGYGTGAVTAALIERGLSVEVVEGSEALCAEAAERHPGLVVHHSLFEDFTPAEPYDGVLCLHVLEHVEHPITMLQAVRSWLKPYGTIVVVVPNAESLHRRLAVRMGLQPRLDTLSDRDRLVGHRRVYTRDELHADLWTAGFRLGRCFGYFLKVVPNSMMLEWDPRLIDALSAISEELPPHLLANIGVAAHRS